jgi:hypothetical protein
MGAVVLDNGRIRMVLAMFQITQGEPVQTDWSARASCLSTAMVSMLLAGKKRPSMRTAVALIHGWKSC